MYVYTEQGVAMLSSALRIKCAVQVNFEIMWASIKEFRSNSIFFLTTTDMHKFTF